MRIPDWFLNIIYRTWGPTNGQVPPKQEPIVLNFRHFPELRDLQRFGATQEQLEASQKGFELLEDHGHATDIEHIAEKCLPIILRTGKATPKHLRAYFEILTTNINHAPINKQQSIRAAEDIARAINEGHSVQEIPA